MSNVQLGWVDEMFGIPVERHPIPRPPAPGGNKPKPYMRMNPTAKFVTHSGENLPMFTAESFAQFKAGGKKDRRVLRYRSSWTDEEERNGMDGLIAQLSRSHAAPHFAVGDDRIVQFREIGIQGAALVDPANRLAFVQVECSGNTEGRTGVWRFTEKTGRPYTALLAYSFKHFGIPARVPGNWPDNMDDCPLPWAVSTNSRRRSPIWETEGGVFMHLEVDGNLHFDCAYLARSEYVAAAMKMADLGEGETGADVPLDPKGKPDVDPLIGLRKGSRGDAVGELQDLLLAKGFDIGKSGRDEKFGPDVEKGLLNFERSKGLPPNTTIDATTAKFLRG